MNKTEITSKELNKKVRKFKAKIIRGKIVSVFMLVTLATMLLICAILVAMGFTGEESLLIYWLYIVLGSVAFLCVYPGLYALIRLPRIIKLFKRIKELERTDTIREMIFDLETSKVVEFGDKAILSDKYLFPKNFKRLPIPCNEIYWIYTSTYKGYASIKLGTKNDGIISYSGIECHNRRYDAILKSAIVELQKRSDTELLLRYSSENEAKYKKMIGR
ncbi:MAG: hypothetical protein IIW79_03495 [Clostridia bacterium]|nr:hypothetical protein [Clostridia bacterium]